MADATLPLTKSAQKLKPYIGPVPAYVEKIEEAARRAGLTVVRMDAKDEYWDAVRLYLSGSKEQAQAFSLLYSAERIHWPNGPRVPTKVDLLTVHPLGSSSAAINRVGENRFVIGVYCELPALHERLEHDIDLYVFGGHRESEQRAFVGSKESLIEAGIAGADMFPDDSTETGRLTTGHYHDVPCGGFTFRVGETIRLEGHLSGLWSYCRDMGKIRRLEDQQQKEKEKGIADYKSPGEWLEAEEDWVIKTLRIIFRPQSIETKHGMRYTVSAAQLESVKQQIEAAAQAIRSIPVKVERIAEKAPKKESAKLATSAATDGKFQHFMQSVMRK